MKLMKLFISNSVFWKMYGYAVVGRLNGQRLKKIFRRNYYICMQLEYILKSSAIILTMWNIEFAAVAKMDHNSYCTLTCTEWDFQSLDRFNFFPL